MVYQIYARYSGSLKKLTVYGIWFWEVYWKINKSYGLLDMYVILRNSNNFLKSNDFVYFSNFTDLDTQVKNILYGNIAESQEF